MHGRAEIYIASQNKTNGSQYIAGGFLVHQVTIRFSPQRMLGKNHFLVLAYKNAFMTHP